LLLFCDKLRAAKILGIGKTTLYRKLHSYEKERRSGFARGS